VARVSLAASLVAGLFVCSLVCVVGVFVDLGRPPNSFALLSGRRWMSAVGLDWGAHSFSANSSRRLHWVYSGIDLEFLFGIAEFLLLRLLSLRIWCYIGFSATLQSYFLGCGLSLFWWL